MWGAQEKSEGHIKKISGILPPPHFQIASDATDKDLLEVDKEFSVVDSNILSFSNQIIL